MKINKRNSIIAICCFLILLYVFNISIASRIYPSDSLATLSVIGSIFILFITGKILKINKIQFLCLILGIIAIVMELFNNYYIIENRSGNVIKFTVFLLLPFILSVNQKGIHFLYKFLKIFCLEHAFFTIFVQFFKNLYSSIILPWIANGQFILATENFLDGYNPGLTSHYSMNGMYLSIAVIYFFSLFLGDRKKKNLFYLIISLIALLLTAKRAHLLFSILSCMSIYIVANKDKISKRIFKVVAIAGASIISVFILSMFVPQVLTVLERFEEGAKSGNLLNGRENFYELTFEMWNKHKLFGNGWGAFSYYYQEILYDVGYGAEFLDAHNVYLQLLCEVGIIGFLFFISIMLFILINTLKLIKEKNIVIMILN